MHRDFSGTAFEPVEKGRDRELTLGPMSLIALFFVLCAICVTCFVWGYSVGHRGTRGPAEQQAAANAVPSSQPLSGQGKPNASQNSVAPQTDAQIASEPTAAAPEADESGSSTSASGAVPAATQPPAASSTRPAVVQAALPGQEAAAKLAAASGQVQPALAQAEQWMVQIAAVSHQEDADVLVSALRKRSYAVSARRDPADNLLHVQVGPFTSHADAASMRERLLGDGYNALIEP